MNRDQLEAKAQGILERLLREADHGRDPLMSAARVIAALEGGVSRGLIRAEPTEPTPYIGRFDE